MIAEFFHQTLLTISHKDHESCGDGVMLAIESSISNKFLPSPNHLE